MSEPRDDLAFLDIQGDALEWIGKHGTDKLVAELREAVTDRRRVKLGTLNTLVLLAHIDKLEAERQPASEPASEQDRSDRNDDFVLMQQELRGALARLSEVLADWVAARAIGEAALAAARGDTP